MLSVVSLSGPQLHPRHIDISPMSTAVGKPSYLDSRKPSALNLKKRASKRSPSKYTRHAVREQFRPRKARKKGVPQKQEGHRIAGTDEEAGDDEIQENDMQVDARPLEVPRIDIVQASPSIGSRSPDASLVRSPSMPAVLHDQVPEYTKVSQPFKPVLTRPLTTPSLQTSSSSPGWDCNEAGTSGRLPLLPLPGTPAVELARQEFGSQDAGVPLHTCVTDTTQSMPVTFNFPRSNASHSSSSPSGRQDNDKYTSNNTAPNSGFEWKDGSSRSTSLSSSLSLMTNQVRVLRITNPDPPSPVGSAAPSRTPSMTIAQKRFVSCPPAPLFVKRANEYKAATKAVPSSFDSPSSRSTGTPTSASNSASTPSFHFSDGGRSPATPASALSSLPATPTKFPAGSMSPATSKYGYKNLLTSPKGVTGVKSPESCIIAPPVTHSLQATATIPITPKTANIPTSRKAGRVNNKGGKKVRRLKRTKSSSSGDGDRSEGFESCFESVGAPSEHEHVTIRKRRGLAKTKKVKASNTKKFTVQEESVSRVPEPSQEKSAQNVQAVESRKEVKVPRSPLLLDKPYVGAALDLTAGMNFENLTTFWTPIGRVIIAPVASSAPSGLKLPGAPASPIVPPSSQQQPELSKAKDDGRGNAQSDKERNDLRTPRAFLVPPRSPRPPNTRRLGNNTRDLLSKSELYPPQYEKKKNLLSVPQFTPFQSQNASRAGNDGSIGNISLSLSLPLPSPMKLDVFTNDLLARCTGVDHDTTINTSKVPNTDRRYNVDDEAAKKMDSENLRIEEFKRKALPSPGDPFISVPNDTGYKEITELSSTVRPSLHHTHPFTLHPSVQAANGLRQSVNKGDIGLPRRLPPPLPPRPEKRRDAVPSIAGLREQLVANGGLVSGDDEAVFPCDSLSQSHYRDQKKHRQNHHRHRNNENHRHNKQEDVKREHRYHNHKKATLFRKEYEEEEDAIIIPIKKTFPDGVALMEYERARSLQEALANQEVYKNHGQQRHGERERDESRYAGNKAMLPVPTPSAYPEQRLDQHLRDSRNGEERRNVRNKVYYEEHKKSGFEILQRQHDVGGYTREEGQERGRGRERDRRRGAAADMEGGEVDDTEGEGGGEEAEHGAVRLGEHKRGFDSCEIERWLDGLRRAAYTTAEQEMDMC